MAKILVVDDCNIVRTLVSVALLEAGHDVDEAENGAVFVEMAASAEWDLVLLDIMMPVLNGPGALRAYRAGGGEAPVVLITSGAEATVADSFGDEKFAAHLLKPLSQATIAERVDRILAARAP